MTDMDKIVLMHHGIRKSILGSSPPLWIEKYASDILRFIEYERKALPCALMRSKDGSSSTYTYSTADMEARCVMEQRIQSMVCCFSMVDRVISNQSQELRGAKPLVALPVGEVVGEIFEKMKLIPSLMTTYLLKPLKSGEHDKQLKVNQIEETIIAIEQLLRESPKGLTKLREIILGIRQHLLKIENSGHAKARYVCTLISRIILVEILHYVGRLGQLADILVLWAFTSNFSVPQQFDPLESQPITVTARELGTNIPRNKIYKAYTSDDRKRSSRLHPAQSKTSTTLNSPHSSKAEQDDISLIEESTNIPSEDAAAVEAKNHVTSFAHQDQAFDELQANETATDCEVRSSPTAAEMGNEQESNPDRDSEVPTAESEATINQSRFTKTGGHRDYYLSPNEPVFLGAKKYPPLFCFWQVRPFN
jgi:hypothetical protein